MIKSKKMIIYALSLMLFTLLVGCGNINLRSSTLIDENESGSVKLQIVYDNFISSIVNKDIIEHKWAKENGYIINKYSKNNMNVEEITYEFKNIRQLEEKINSNGLAIMTHSKKRDVRGNIYTIDLKFNKALIDKLIKDKSNTESTETNQKIYNYIENIKFTSEIKVSGIVIESNATENINENTKDWSYKLSQIDENTNMLFSYTT